MSHVKIAINYAIMIERLRSEGVENNQLVTILKEKNYEFLNQFGKGMPDWEALVNLFNQGEDEFQSILNEGYHIKFLTKGSLMTLLRLKYGIEVEKDYDDKGTAIEGIILSNEAVETVKNTLAPNWKLSTYVDKEDDISKVRIELLKSSELTSI